MVTAIALVAVVVPLSLEVVATIVSLTPIVSLTLIVSLTPIVSLSLSWCSVSVDVHGDWGIVHPSWCIG